MGDDKVVLNVLVSKKVKEIIKARCEELGMTMSEYVRWLIREELMNAGLLDGDDE